ncbi:hypothetical protein ATCC27039_27120 [Actinomyces naeslundii]|nr:hypothetical protein ATCC27039_27120 [Actinomyces naeslundii]
MRSDSTALVDDVDLRLAPGSRTALVGASGAGKSLTCAALAGTLPAGLEVSGSLTVDPDGVGSGNGSRADCDQGGRTERTNLLGLPAARRPRGCRIALVPQDHSTALHPLIPVGRQISLASQASGRTLGEADQRATDYLYAVGLGESLADRVPSRLSGGQRQRISLALALAAEPALMIADEPTTALDVVARAEILRLLTSLTSLPEAPALLLITHDLPAAAICENVVVLHGGAVIERGPAAQVLARPEHPVTAAMCEAAAEETIDGALAAAGAAA